MDKGISEYEYVDLELPSGTKWATMNVGASKPSDYGLYFQFGDTQGYSEDQVGEGNGQKTFFWDNYKLSIDGSYKNFSKYATTGVSLKLEDDAANAIMGGDWHIPTPDQIKELLDNTTSTRETLDGVNGMTFTSKKNTSKMLFIPAAGNAFRGKVNDIGDFGYIWSSMLSIFDISSGQGLCFDLGIAYSNFSFARDSGCSVRGVIG